MRLAQRAIHQLALGNIAMRDHHAQWTFSQEATDPGLRPASARWRGEFIFERETISTAGNHGADAGGQFLTRLALPARIRLAKLQILHLVEGMPGKRHARL